MVAKVEVLTSFKDASTGPMVAVPWQDLTGPVDALRDWVEHAPLSPVSGAGHGQTGIAAGADRAECAGRVRLVKARPCDLPEVSLLAMYRDRGAYTDCYGIDLPGPVALSAYVAAFYTTRIFKLERLVLRWLVKRPSTDLQARQLATSKLDCFAAWQVEQRSENQLLMCDLYGRTRSWLMVAPSPEQAGTRLYFGSAVVPGPGKGEKPKMARTFRLLLGFHKLYSRVLLNAAAARLRRSAS